MADANLTIAIKGRDEAGRLLDRIKRDLASIGKTAAGVGVGIIGAGGIEQAASTILRFASSATRAASDLKESVNAVNVVFREAAPIIHEWGQTAATSAGLSQRAFNQLAAPLGSMLKNAGFTIGEVANKTIELTQRAADMASVFNTDVESALVAIQAALRGETDPIEKFGVSMNAAAVEARALAQTGKQTAAALTEQEKAAARVSLILSRTAQVAGDFANTAGEAANSTRTMNAQIEEQQAAIGEKLLPVMVEWKRLQLEIVTILADQVVPAIQDVEAAWSSLRNLLQQDVDIPLLGKLGSIGSLLGDLAEGLAASVPGIAVARTVGSLIGGGGGRTGETTQFGDPASAAAASFDLIARTSRAAADSTDQYNRAVGGAAKTLQTMHDVLNEITNAARGIFGRSTREEAQLQLRIAELDKAIATVNAQPQRGFFTTASGTRAFGDIPADQRAVPQELIQQREALQKQLELMEADNRIQELRLELADETLLSEQQQMQVVEELIPLLQTQSFWVKESASSFIELVPAVRGLLSTLRGNDLGPGAVAPGLDPYYAGLN